MSDFVAVLNSIRCAESSEQIAAIIKEVVPDQKIYHIDIQAALLSSAADEVFEQARNSIWREYSNNVSDLLAEVIWEHRNEAE